MIKTVTPGSFGSLRMALIYTIIPRAILVLMPVSGVVVISVASA